MKLIVGLGNPGERYRHTRHNIGFMVLDALADGLCNQSLPTNTTAPKTPAMALHVKSTWRERFGGMFCEADATLKDSTTRILLLKPLTYMNLSGESVQEAFSFYKIQLGELCVVHDEIDLSFGSIRIRQGGGEGGHNGLRSISGSLGSSEYLRVRIGVSRPSTQSLPSSPDDNSDRSERHRSVSDWVLSRFNEEEQVFLSDFVVCAARAALAAALLPLDAAQRGFQRTATKPDNKS